MSIDQLLERYTRACLEAVGMGYFDSAGIYADIAAHYAFVLHPELRA